MKQENLDELKNIYLGLVTGGEGPEVLNEAPNNTPTLNKGLTGLLGLPQIGPSSSEIQKNFQRGEEQRKQDKVDRATNQRAQLGVVRAGNKYIAKSDTTAYDTEKGAQAIMLANRLNRETGLGKPKPVQNRFEIEKERLKNVGNNPETAAQIDARVAALNAKKEPPAAAPVTPTTAPRPAASGPVLSKLKGVEGTGVGANFKAKAFTDTERTRYSSVAAQNAARTSAASGTTPKPVASTAPPTATTADKIKGGLSNYQSQVKSGDVKGAEETGKSTFALANPKLAAAQAEKDRIRGTSQTDNPLMKDMKDRMPMTPSVQSPTLAKDLGVGTPSSSGNQSLLDNPNASKAAKPTPPIPNINKLKTESKVEQLNWPSIKTVRDIADAYTDIYEKHNDGNLANNYPPYNKVTRGDVIAGATGNDEMGGNDKMGRKKKKKPSNKKRMNPYLKAINSDFEMWIDGLLNEGYDLSNYTWNEVYEIYENAIVLTEEEYGIYSLVLEHLLSNGYAETEHDANIIIENMSDKWVDVIIDEAYKGGPEFGMKYSKSKPLSGEKGDGSGYGPPEKFTKPDDKIEKPGTTVPPFKKGGYGRIMSNIPHGIGPHRDKTASRITTITGGDPKAPTSQKMREPDKKRLSREIVRKKPQA